MWLASRGQRASLPSGKKHERKKKTANPKVACWNISIMQDSEDRPQRRLALVARELARLDINIAGLSEVRFAEQGSSRKMEQAVPSSGLVRTRRSAAPLV